MDYRNILTVCPYCGTGCGLYIQVLDGEIVGVLPAKEHPVSNSCLMLGWGHRGRPVHVVCAPKKDYLVIITAYLPSEDYWEPDWRTRKR